MYSYTYTYCVYQRRRLTVYTSAEQAYYYQRGIPARKLALYTSAEQAYYYQRGIPARKLALYTSAEQVRRSRYTSGAS